MVEKGENLWWGTRRRGGLEPLEQTAAFFDADIEAVGAEFDGIDLEGVTFAVGVPAIFQIEFEAMDGAADVAIGWGRGGGADIGLGHGSAGVGTGGGEGEPFIVEAAETEVFAGDLEFGIGDVAAGPLYVGRVDGELMPFVFFGHQNRYSDL
jgi:hypothetical protein